ncbi:hypothetical protein L6164_019145 [Bauhinia variegata]|uniref:Uncharacterized protein n=1 Tax=Bauhinia variegata TaxID=167791 RepID=A0ACB9ND97_BAUVA|nr:hypothetical protein L6164_019145 [Bauhinia variegata]
MVILPRSMISIQNWSELCRDVKYVVANANVMELAVFSCWATSTTASCPAPFLLIFSGCGKVGSYGLTLHCEDRTKIALCCYEACNCKW